MLLKRTLPVVVALLFGFATLFGLLALPPVSNLILAWASFLAAVALVVGVLNLLAIHVRRASRGNVYSLILVLSMLSVFALAVTDALALTEDGVNTVFSWVQAPLEAALSSLLAFFLLFAGVRLLQQQRNIWTGLFLLTAILLLLSQSPLPAPAGDLLRPAQEFVNTVLVTAGVRGLLLGVALGIITLSVRLLAGLERPYSP